MAASFRAVPLAAALALALAPPPARAAEQYILRCGTGVHGGEGLGTVLLPSGGVFCPLFADPKAVRSFASWVTGEFPTSTDTRHVGAVGIGDGVAFVRWGGPRPGEGLQLGIEAAVLSQFDLDAPSAAVLLNSDFIVGLPVTFRIRSFSARARVFHQSSHLGDELLLRAESTIQREDVSFESAELILSLDLGPLRVYGGGEYLFDRRPSTLDDLVGHAGAELRVGPASGARFVAAVDVKAGEQHDWKAATSVKGGLELAWWRRDDHPPRLASLVVELYDGPSPYGQFFLESTRYVGAGIQFQL